MNFFRKILNWFKSKKALNDALVEFVAANRALNDVIRLQHQEKELLVGNYMYLLKAIVMWNNGEIILSPEILTLTHNSTDEAWLTNLPDGGMKFELRTAEQVNQAQNEAEFEEDDE